MFKDETIITEIRGLKGLKKFPALSFMGGPALGQIHLLKEGEYIVGRSRGCTIMVNDDAISRQHFKILVSEEAATLHDLGSTNGTYVNGNRVTERVLQDKDTIQISSQTVITFTYVSDFEAQKQQQIYQMANFDAVTQARTKQYFLDQIDQEFSHASRKENPLSLILFDLDHFKEVNDTHGHPAGDFVLKKVAEITQQVIRNEDLFARYGGEEFVILMRDALEEDAIRLAERLRKLIAATDFVFEDKKIKVTLSLGVANLQQGNYETVAAFIKGADDYLYFAKHNGRNRVASFKSLTSQK